MKKIFSFILILVSLLVLNACGNDSLGDFPEVKESQKVEMTTAEVNTLLADVDFKTQMEDTVMLTVELDMAIHQEITTWGGDKTGDQDIKIKLSSKTFVSLSDQIAEVMFLSENSGKYENKNVYLDKSIGDIDETIEGKLNIYFKDQNLYYESSLTGLPEDEFIKNGKFKMNVGITQAMWDESYNNPEGALDDFVGINFNPIELIESMEMLTVLIDAGLLNVYKSGSTHTIMLNINKQNVMENKQKIFDALVEAGEYTVAEFEDFEAELNDTFGEAEIFDLSVGFVLKDGIMKKLAVEVRIKMTAEDESLDLSAKIILDLGVKAPAFPRNLNTYELTTMPGFLN